MLQYLTLLRSGASCKFASRAIWQSSKNTVPNFFECPLFHTGAWAGEWPIVSRWELHGKAQEGVAKAPAFRKASGTYICHCSIDGPQTSPSASSLTKLLKGHGLSGGEGQFLPPPSPQDLFSAPAAFRVRDAPAAFPEAWARHHPDVAFYERLRGPRDG
jgi:hypothetical protein